MFPNSAKFARGQGTNRDSYQTKAKPSAINRVPPYIAKCNKLSGNEQGFLSSKMKLTGCSRTV
jgi:hypothetical protein